MFALAPAQRIMIGQLRVTTSITYHVIETGQGHASLRLCSSSLFPLFFLLAFFDLITLC
jgi:hypothetical protein